MAGTYSKAYQEIVSGRTREDEAIGFYGDNKVAVPDRTTAFNVIGGKTQPTLEKDNLQHEGIGKPGTSADNASAYNPNSYNASA